MDLLGIGQANCFRTHNELTMGLLGKCPLAPSEYKYKIARDYGPRGTCGNGTRNTNLTHGRPNNEHGKCTKYREEE